MRKPPLDNSAPPPPPRSSWISLCFAAFVCVAIVAWFPITRVGLTGEDYFIFGQIDRGESFTTHVFRPLREFALRTTYALCGTSAPGLHLLSLLIHLASAVVVFALARMACASAVAAVAATVAYALGAGAVDPVIWATGVNYQLSGIGGLLAAYGACRVLHRRRGAWPILSVGYATQWLANENVHGTSLLLVALAVGAAWPRRLPGWRSLSAFAVIALGASVVRHFGFETNPLGEAELARRLAPDLLWNSIHTRADAFVSGYGASFLPGLVVLAAGAAALCSVRGARTAWFVTAWWFAALVPHVLIVVPASYRFSVSAAPSAILVSGLIAWVGTRVRAQWIAGVLVTALGVGCWIQLDRTLAAWRDACVEVAAVVEAIESETSLGVGDDVALINADLSLSAPFEHLTGVEPGSADRGFFDSAHAYERLGDPPDGPWWGRRWDGSYGAIDPETYFDGRTAVEPTMLYARAVFVPSTRVGLDRLADPEHDGAVVAVIQTEDGRAPAGFPIESPPVEATAPRLEILTGVEVRGGVGESDVRVVSDRPVFVVSHDDWYFLGQFRFSPDYSILVRKQDIHMIQHRARLADGTALATFRANAHGTAALVPAGDHVVTLRWKVVAPGETW